MIPIRLKSGAVAHFVSLHGERGVLRSPESSPPGYTVSGTIDGVTSEFQLKVNRCRKEGEEFLLEGRIQNAAKAMREVLATVADQPA